MKRETHFATMLALPWSVALRVCELGVHDCHWSLHTLWSMLYVCRDWRAVLIRADMMRVLRYPVERAPEFCVRGFGGVGWQRALLVLRQLGDQMCVFAGSAALSIAYDDVAVGSRGDIDLVVRGTQSDDSVLRWGYANAYVSAPYLAHHGLSAESAHDLDRAIFGVLRRIPSGIGTEDAGEALYRTLLCYPRCARGIPRHIHRYELSHYEPHADLIAYANERDAPRPLSPHDYVCATFDFDFCRLTTGYDAQAERWRVRCGDVGAFVHRRTRAPDAETTSPCRAEKYRARGFTVPDSAPRGLVPPWLS